MRALRAKQFGSSLRTRCLCGGSRAIAIAPWSSAGLRLRLIERVAGGADGADEVGLALAVERLAQAPYVHIDGARLDIDLRTPDRVQELLAAEHAAGMLEEVPEQPEFGRAQMDVAAAALHTVRGQVHHHIGIVHDLGFDRVTRAPEDS